MQTWTYPQHRPDIDGPWRDEPDKAQWVDEATDLDCLAVRNPLGAWCGYVGVPPGHPWHGRDYMDIDNLNVHGGLTFAAMCDENTDPDHPHICHVPAPGRPGDVWWLGFDCAHGGMDHIPGLATAMTEAGIKNRQSDGQYRTLDYVRAECTNLAAQVAYAGRQR